MEVIPAEMLNESTQYFINTTGRFVVGGPQGDCGLTGRKIIMDTYGGFGYHGGGAFSGKDPSKVDRSASYMCRYVAKNIVAAGLAEKCEIQVAYTIGRADPVSVMVGAYSTGVLPSQELTEIVKKEFDLRPAAIIERLDLLRPIYQKTSNYGHFGRELPEFSWEKTDMINTLKSAVK
jgi:S-adenosylmethionine synthetase